ncbi:MAG: tetratricopeptide repeat protein [Candidatus Adiutrix sp.]
MITPVKRPQAWLITLVFALIISGCSGAPSQRQIDKHNSMEQARLMINLGAALLMEGEHVRALNELLKAQQIVPNSADIYNYLGLAYFGMEQFDLAAESYRTALRLAPQRTDVHNNLGQVYLARGEYDNALEQFNICLKDLVYQQSHLPLTNIGLVYMEMGRLNEAMVPLLRATKIAPDYYKSYQLIGRIYLKQGRPNDALDYLVNATRLYSNDPETFMLMGDTYIRLNNPEEAAQSFSQVTALVPNTPLALEAQKKARQAMGFE